MFKKILALMCLTLSIVLFCMAVSATEAENTDINAIYVSGTAAEGGTGVFSAPVSTLADAYSLLGNGGTIYLMDTVTVSATEGDCFIAPAHAGKITITSAESCNGTLDFTEIEHFHFGGETELNNIGIVANEVVLTADNHCLTMGEGLAMSSPLADSYRGGHTYCGAKIHLAAYAPCETANVTCEAAGGRLNVYSGEYWSVSAWYGEDVTITGGETQIYIGTFNESDNIWLRYLCPAMYSSAIESTLSCTDSTVTVIVNDGVNTLDAYRFTKNDFSGSMTVNWLLHNSAQGNSYAFVAKDFYPADDATCMLNVYTDQSNVAAKDCAKLLMRGANAGYSGENIGDKPLSTYEHTHQMYTELDGRILCVFCEYEQCRHLTHTINILEEACCTRGNYLEKLCTDICGETLEMYYDDNINPENHADYLHEYIADYETMEAVSCCVGCRCEFSRIYVGEASNYVPVIDDSNFSGVMELAAAYSVFYGDVMISLGHDVKLSVPANYRTPKFDAHITVSGGTIYFPDIPRHIYMNGDMTFENLTFKTAGTYNGAHIYAQNHKLVMGEGIVMGNNSTIPTGEGYPDCNSVRMYIAGGFEGPTDNVMNTDVTIRSGDYWFVGGFNRNASTNNGTSNITIGKTNSDDYLSINYLTPFSTGDGYITEPSTGNITVDGDANVRWFYVTTMNKATTDVMYTTNLFLNGSLNKQSGTYRFDVRGCPSPYPLTTVNIWYDDSNDNYRKVINDSTYEKIGAIVNLYPISEDESSSQ